MRRTIYAVVALLFVLSIKSYSWGNDIQPIDSLENNNSGIIVDITVTNDDIDKNLYETPQDFTVGCEFGEFERVNNDSTADDLKQTIIWLNGSFDKVFPIETSYGDGSTNLYCCVFEDDGGNDWIMVLDIELLSDIERYSSLCKHSICVRGSYAGISTELQMPGLYLEKAFDRTTGVVVASRFFKLAGFGAINTAEAVSEKTTEDTLSFSSCRLYIEIDFAENLVFSRYDVELYLDDQYIATLPHGKFFTQLLDVSIGNHNLIFKERNGGNYNSEQINVSTDSTFTCRIETSSSRIDVSKKHITESIGETTIKMPNTVGMLYSEALKELRKLGFVNIDYNTVGDHFIWDDDNWLVQAQNIMPDAEVVKSEDVLLECISLDDYFNKYYTGKDIGEIQNSAKESGFDVLFKDDSGSSMDETIKKMDNKAKKDWIAIGARQYSGAKRTAVVTIEYTGVPTPSPTTKVTPTPAATSELDYLISNGWTYEGTFTANPIEENTESSNGLVATPKATTGSASTSNHSSNNRRIAKKGNSGVYAYRSKGGSYYTYYIIDFDEGYVYYFADGNGDQSCDKIKIDSGDLNNGLQITYHDGNQKWSNWLHFKWKNQPEIMIVLDDDYFEWSFYETSLSNALSIKSMKKIVNY